MNKNIKNILLDFGGVICNLDWEKMRSEFKKLSSDTESANRRALELDLYIRFETGLVSEKDFIDSGKKILGQNISEDQFVGAWNSILANIPRSRIELLEKLGEKYNLYLLSNNNIIHHRYIDEVLLKSRDFGKIDSYFKKCFMSYEIKIRKPDLESFQYVLNDLNLAANEILFIDDDQKNIEAAKQIGMQSYFLDLNTEVMEEAVQKLSLL